MDEPGEFFDLAPHVDPWLDPWRDDPSGAGPDIPFYEELAREADGPALELGVGTGRVYLELLSAGFDVDGIDASERSLAHLRDAAAEREREPSVWTGDMAALDVDRSYGLIYAPSRAFNHLARLADQRAALSGVLDALRPDGVFALNTFVPSYEVVVEHYGEPVEDEVTVDEDTYRLVTTSSLDDEVEQVTRIHRELYRNGEFVGERETPLAQIPKRQFELLFEAAGFGEWSVYGGFEYQPLERADQEMVWIARA